MATEVIGPETKLQVVDALLTGIHSPQESHYRLLGALVDDAILARMIGAAEHEHLRPHEFGDVALVSAGTGRDSSSQMMSLETPARSRPA